MQAHVFTQFIIASELRNDYEDTTEKINQKIQVLHSAKLAPISDSIKDPGE